VLGGLHAPVAPGIPEPTERGFGCTPSRDLEQNRVLPRHSLPTTPPEPARTGIVIHEQVSVWSAWSSGGRPDGRLSTSWSPPAMPPAPRMTTRSSARACLRATPSLRARLAPAAERAVAPDRNGRCPRTTPARVSQSHGGDRDTTAAGRVTFHIFGAVAEFEGELIRGRTQAGLAATGPRGRHGGMAAAAWRLPGGRRRPEWQ
jgi:hypothetical protein